MRLNCEAMTVDDVDGKDILTVNGIRYHDHYVKKDGKWRIQRLRSIFLIADKRELNQ